MFIIPYDYQAHIKDGILDEIIQSDATVLRRAELSAIDEVKSYLEARYQVDQIFLDLKKFSRVSTFAVDDYVVVVPKKYDPAVENLAGEIVQYRESYYLAKVTTTGQIADKTKYTLVDYVPVYKVVQEASGKVPEVDEGYFTQADPRNPMVVQVTMDIILYRLAKRIAPDQVPTTYQEGRDEAIDWLNKVVKQILNPSLPEPESGEKEEFRLGSNPYRHVRW